MINSVNVTGRLTRDPELRTTSGGKSACSFSLAVQKRYKSPDDTTEADFFDVVAWNKDADYVVNYCSKGQLVGVTGRLQTRKYTASDGTEKKIVEIVAENVSGLERKKVDAPAQHESEDPFA